MKLAIILPGDASQDYREKRREFIKNFVSHGTEVEVLSTGGPKTITTAVDFALIAPGAVSRVIEAEKAGFDGVSL